MSAGVRPGNRAANSSFCTVTDPVTNAIPVRPTRSAEFEAGPACTEGSDRVATAAGVPARRRTSGFVSDGTRRTTAGAFACPAIRANGVPTLTVSPGGKSDATVPPTGARRSKVALSASHSASKSPARIASPTRTFHSTTVTFWSAGLDPTASRTNTPAPSPGGSGHVTSRSQSSAAAARIRRNDGNTSSWFT